MSDGSVQMCVKGRTDAELLETFASLVEVVDGDARMTKALRLVIAVVVLEVGVFFCAFVPSQLEDPLNGATALGFDVLGLSIDVGVCQEVEAEITGIMLVDEIHAQNILIELETLLGVLDPEHGMVESVRGGLCGGGHFV